MARLERFSRALCEQLLESGYTHFLVKHQYNKNRPGAGGNIVAFEPVRGRIDKNAVLIKQIIDLPEGTAIRYYVINVLQELEQA